MIKLLVFDLDDTLYPEHEYVDSGFMAVGNYMRKQYNIKDFYTIAKKIFNGGARGTVFDQALEQAGIERSRELIMQLVDVYREHEPVISLYDDAKWALAFFKAKFKLGLLTDGFMASQRNKVRALGIEQYFDIIVYSDELQRENWKPSPRPFEKIMERSGFRGIECAYIGDNPLKDFIAAKKLGWTTVHVCREYGEYSKHKVDEEHEAAYRIFSLYELESLLKELKECSLRNGTE